MSSAPPGATCALHQVSAAVSTCPRCGSFMCPDCERRTRPAARPMCPACWALRAQRVTPQVQPPETRLASVGFGLGIASLLPLFPVWIASLVVNAIALFKRDEAFRRIRWKPVTGLVLTLGSVTGWVIVIILIK